MITLKDKDLITQFEILRYINFSVLYGNAVRRSATDPANICRLVETESKAQNATSKLRPNPQHTPLGLLRTNRRRGWLHQIKGYPPALTVESKFWGLKHESINRALKTDFELKGWFECYPARYISLVE